MTKQTTATNVKVSIELDPVNQPNIFTPIDLVSSVFNSKTLELSIDKPKPRKRRFVTRTIRNGSVRIFGELFVSNKALPLRFNGIRAVFGLYWVGEKWEDSFVYLWGTEEESRQVPLKTPTTFVENGQYRWEWWLRC